MSEAKTPATSTNKTGRLKNNLWFAYIVFLILWTGCVYSELGRMINRHELFARVIEGHPYVSDFVNVYNSAALAAACQKEKIDIYSPVLQAEYEKKLTAPVVAEQPFYLQYPPFLFALVRPLAFFDLLGAWLVWCSMGITLLIVAAIYLTLSSTRVKDNTNTSAEDDSDQTVADKKAPFRVGRFTMAFVILAILGSFPTWLSVELGQTSLLLVSGLVAFWLCCQKHRYFYAGLASGVAMIKLQYLPPVFFIGLVLGGWSYLGGFTLVGLTLLGLCVLTLGIDNVARFPQALLNGESGQGVSGVAADQMQNLRGNLTLIAGSDNYMVHIISLTAFALTLCALVFLWWRAGKTWWRTTNPKTSKSSGASHFRVLASLSTLVMLVGSPHCHTQDYVVLVIPCIWLWFEIAKLREHGNTSKSLVLMQGLILFFPLLGWPFFVLRVFFQLAKIQPFFIWAVVLIILSYRLYADMMGDERENGV